MGTETMIMGLPDPEFGPLDEHGKPTRAHGEPPRPTPETTWGDYVNSSFGLDDDGRMFCTRCGAYVRPGWQFDHCEELHAPRFGI